MPASPAPPRGRATLERPGRPARPDPGERRDLVVLSEVRWSYFRTRKQFLLSRFPERWRIFFAQPPAAGGDDPWTPRREGKVTCFTVPFLKPGTTQPAYNALMRLPPARALVEAAAEVWLERMLARLGVEPEPVLLVSNIYAALAISRDRKSTRLNSSHSRASRMPSSA